MLPAWVSSVSFWTTAKFCPCSSWYILFGTSAAWSFAFCSFLQLLVMEGHASISLFWLSSAMLRNLLSSVSPQRKEQLFLPPKEPTDPVFLKINTIVDVKEQRLLRKERCYRMHCDLVCCWPLLKVQYLSMTESQHQCCLASNSPAVPFLLLVLHLGSHPLVLGLGILGGLFVCLLGVWVCGCFSLMSTIWLWKLLGIFVLRNSFCHPWAYSHKLYFQVLKLPNFNISPPKFPMETLGSVSNTR